MEIKGNKNIIEIIKNRNYNRFSISIIFVRQLFKDRIFKIFI